jgi:hypothetical protein
MLKRVHQSSSIKKLMSLGPLMTAMKELVVSQIVFVPLAFLIPLIYGTAYTESVNFALILILARFLFSAIKLFNYYAVLSNRFDIPILLYSIYIVLYMSIFLFFKPHNHDYSWQISSIIASLGVALLGFFTIRKLNVDKSSSLLIEEIAGTTSV